MLILSHLKPVIAQLCYFAHFEPNEAKIRGIAYEGLAHLSELLFKMFKNDEIGY